MTATPLRIRAELARRGLMGHQRTPYENPDTERMVYPNSDPETIAEAWRFIAWLETELTE